jgi:pimeloyl-ACP methyl ester carboxylesterase
MLIRKDGSLCPSAWYRTRRLVLAFHSTVVASCRPRCLYAYTNWTGRKFPSLNELDRISLDTHVKDVTNMLFYEDLSEVVLVGHSYGGMVITGVAANEPQRLAQLVYLDAYLPFEGENEIALWPPDQKEKYRTDLASGIRFRPPLASSMLGITDPKISKWVQERLTPHPNSTYEDPPARGTAQSASIPRTYIHCTLGPLSSWMEPFAERARKLKWNVYTMTVGHDVMITHPNELAEILIRIANK